MPPELCFAAQSRCRAHAHTLGLAHLCLRQQGQLHCVTVSALLSATANEGARSVLPLSCPWDQLFKLHYHRRQGREGEGQFFPAQALGACSPHPLHQCQLYCAAKVRCRACCFTLIPRVSSPDHCRQCGVQGRRHYPNTHQMRGEASSLSLSPSGLAHLPRPHTPSSALLCCPRLGAGPHSLEWCSQ